MAADRRRIVSLVALAAGLGLALYLGGKAPREQHVKIVVGNAAPSVVGLEVQYLAGDGELARSARMTFSPGTAPRVIAHDPELADGDYRLRIDVDMRVDRRSVERRVTLGGGTTQVDLAGLLEPRTAQ